MFIWSDLLKTYVIDRVVNQNPIQKKIFCVDQSKKLIALLVVILITLVQVG